MLHPSEHVLPDCRPHPLPRCSSADRSLQPSSRLPQSLCARVSDSSLLPFILQSEITAHWLRPSLSPSARTDVRRRRLTQSSFPESLSKARKRPSLVARMNTKPPAVTMDPPMLGAPVGQHPCPPVHPPRRVLTSIGIRQC